MAVERFTHYLYTKTQNWNTYLVQVWMFTEGAF